MPKQGADYVVHQGVQDVQDQDEDAQALGCIHELGLRLISLLGLIVLGQAIEVLEKSNKDDHDGHFKEELWHHQGNEDNILLLRQPICRVRTLIKLMERPQEGSVAQEVA